MKTRIRIAVCLNSKGHYASCGWDHGNNIQKDYDEMLQLAQEGIDFPLIHKTFWLEAEIENPFEYAIDGEVKELDSDKSQE